MQDDGPWVGHWRPHRPRGPIVAQYGNPGPKYALPELIGTSQCDPRKPRAPAFSIGTRHKETSTDCSPGPKYLLPSNYTRYGKTGTLGFSIPGRLNPLKSFEAPSSAQYFPENSKRLVTRTAPAFSLSGRLKEITNSQTPGPAAYKLPPIFGAKSILTSSSPSFSFTRSIQKGVVLEDLKSTPAPDAYNAVNPYVFKPKPPQWSIKGRNFPPDKGPQAPGPGTYHPEKGTCTKLKGPSFSFGHHHSPFMVSLM